MNAEIVRKINVKVTFEEGRYYKAKIENFPWCLVTCTNSRETDIKENVSVAVEAHLSKMQEFGILIPDEFKNEYEFVYEFTVEALLNYYGRLFTRPALSVYTGINENQLWYYSTGEKKPRKEQINRIAAGLNKIEKKLQNNLVTY